ncbi:DUF1489 family protein [Enterovirga rhinocerotis]|uniref:DUF1489 family protein n=1 Tax=Enterovirga rhinocerotis TaxID=1339210 RepID=A0A4R7BS02_9HYPH|nr:DUF1489 domain-containing protein [Enterovirga rhinocerotis]TDR88033.1 hypothetical protein EV668_3898 [Enterovirga rhinocerotis]
MPLHMIKLCVGVDTIGELEDWIVEKRRRAGRGADPRHTHVTRMMPKRAEALLEGGSLYWVIKGQLSCRQRLLGLESFTDGQGIGRCRLLLEPELVLVSPRPCRPFQGWRYLEDEDAPADLGSEAEAVGALPEEMRRELVALGLL